MSLFYKQIICSKKAMLISVLGILGMCVNKLFPSGDFGVSSWSVLLLIFI